MPASGDEGVVVAVGAKVVEAERVEVEDEAWQRLMVEVEAEAAGMELEEGVGWVKAEVEAEAEMQAVEWDEAEVVAEVVQISTSTVVLLLKKILALSGRSRKSQPPPLPPAQSASR